MIQALLPLLRESAHPRIVNVSSGAGSHGDDQFGLTRRGGAAASYGIGKAAQNALTSRASSYIMRPLKLARDVGSRHTSSGTLRFQIAASAARRRWPEEAQPKGGNDPTYLQIEK